MSWSFPIAVVKGTVIRVHFTFVLFLVWIGGSAAAQSGPQAAVESVTFMVLLFLCVLLHEFGHVLAARRYGVQTPDITLLPIGGVARLERIPDKPTQEFVIAIAGPAVNVVIAGLLLLIVGGNLTRESMQVDNAGVSLLSRLAAANIFLVLFNLIPAFPMDGGRVLRAVLAHRYGYARGTQIAASVGQFLAFALGFVGLFGNPLLLFIALFVYLAATSEANAVQMREVSRGLLAGDAMVRRFETLRPDSRVEDAVEALLATSQHEFPIVDGSGRMRGLITRDDMIRALRDRGPETSVLEVMQNDIPVIGEGKCLEEALTVMQREHRPATAVIDKSGRLMGLITPENVGELMMIMAIRPPREGGIREATSSGPWTLRR